MGEINDNMHAFLSDNAKYLTIVYRALALIILIIMSIFDIRKKKMPICLLLILGCCGLLFTAINVGVDIKMIIISMLGLVPGALLILAAVFSKKVGIADGIIICELGMVEGFTTGLFTLCIGCLILSVISIVLLIIKKVKRNTEMPFVPFIGVGYVLWMVIFVGG